LNRRTLTIVAAGAIGIVSPSGLAVAQATSTSVQSQKAAGPTVAASTVGIRSATAATTAAPSATQARERNLGAGQNVALMVVGGAAIVIGAAIGGGAGLVLAVGGAIIGLYGLYNFVQ